LHSLASLENAYAPADAVAWSTLDFAALASTTPLITSAYSSSSSSSRDL